jgi:hypothetical protein
MEGSSGKKKDRKRSQVTRDSKPTDTHSKAQPSLNTQAVLAQQKWLNNFIE